MTNLHIPSSPHLVLRSIFPFVYESKWVCSQKFVIQTTVYNFSNMPKLFHFLGSLSAEVKTAIYVEILIINHLKNYIFVSSNSNDQIIHSNTLMESLFQQIFGTVHTNVIHYTELPAFGSTYPKMHRLEFHVETPSLSII